MGLIRKHMMAKKVILVFALVGLCTLSSHVAKAQIPASRSVDWTHAGIPGGIPHGACFQTLSASGGADDSVAIQNAINAAPAGSVICLNAGTYTLHPGHCRGEQRLESDYFGQHLRDYAEQLCCHHPDKP